MGQSITGRTRMNNAEVPVLWIRRGWYVLVVEYDLAGHRRAVGTSAMHFLEGGDHVIASFWGEVEVEYWSVPCCSVDDLVYESHSINECCCEVVYKAVVGRKVDILYLDSTSLGKGLFAAQGGIRASETRISHTDLALDEIVPTKERQLLLLRLKRKPSPIKACIERVSSCRTKTRVTGGKRFP